MSEGADATPFGTSSRPGTDSPGEWTSAERNFAEVVAASGLHRSFPDVEGRGEAGEIHVLQGVDLTIRRGETVSIVGPSGAGKSTLLHLLGGLDRPDAGSVRIGGRDLSLLDDRELAAVRNLHVGFVFQFHHLLRDFSARENVMIPRLVAGADRGEAADRAMTLLRQVGLGERSAHRPSELSGGEQQRVAVARALANDPPLLLADEPSGNLDLKTSERLHDLLFSLVEDHGTALVVVTHNLDLASRAGRTLELSGGVLEPYPGRRRHS